jgi:hypothetical protein
LLLHFTSLKEEDWWSSYASQIDEVLGSVCWSFSGRLTQFFAAAPSVACTWTKKDRRFSLNDKHWRIPLESFLY